MSACYHRPNAERSHLRRIRRSLNYLAARAGLSVKLAGRMEAWLVEGGSTTLSDDETRRIHSLASSIRREGMELMHSVGLTEANDSCSPSRTMVRAFDAAAEGGCSSPR